MRADIQRRGSRRSHRGHPSDEILDGIRIVRRGRQWTVHARAWLWLRRRLDEFDVVVDQVNTIPFLTPLYVPKVKRRLLIFQLAREYWWRDAEGPVPVGRAVRVCRRASVLEGVPGNSRDHDSGRAR